ncbi:MAG: hypothetical protein IAE86_04060 [Burkholderiaceae bacterium]|nr:hypothetical protein [Burkholderiaceae bacterium]
MSLRIAAAVAVAIWVAASGAVAGSAPLTLEPFGFTLRITLSDKAAQRLRKTDEGITVDARYYGDPTPGAARHADEVGQIDLGTERVFLPGRAGTAHVSGSKLRADRLDWTEGDVKVNVNVYSSRRSSSDNLLACDFIDGPVAQVVRAQPVALHCALIEENAETRVRP